MVLPSMTQDAPSTGVAASADERATAESPTAVGIGVGAGLTLVGGLATFLLTRRNR
jgi:hypothetical protein